jgi:acetyl-CoA C-acetyltransferase
LAAYIVDAIRSPRGVAKATGRLHPVAPASLLAQMFEAMQRRNGLDTSLVSDAVIGCVTQTGEQGGNIGKVAAATAGWASSMSAVTVNRFCASGLTALNWASLQAEAGGDLVVAGGVEMMSRVAMFADKAPYYSNAAQAQQIGFLPLPLIADLLATTEGITRADCDAYAATSQQRAEAARSNGAFARSLVPVKADDGSLALDVDETIRAGTTVEKLAGLKTVYEPGAGGLDAPLLAKNPRLKQIEHVHTVANAPCMADGAALVLIGDEAAIRSAGLKPRARIVARAEASSSSGLGGDVAAARKVLHIAGLSTSQIDLFEVRDSFAAATVYFMRQLGVPIDRFNVNGSSIALGHPLGATGAMLVSTLIDELERRSLRTGLAAITGAMGVASAVIIETVA